MTNINRLLGSYRRVGSTRTTDGMINFDEVPMEETPLNIISPSSAYTFSTSEIGYAHYMIIPSDGTTFTLPSMSSDNATLHTLEIQFNTNNSASVGFAYPSGSEITVSGVTTLATGKSYTAICRWRLAQNGTTWKWVVSIIEDVV